MSHNNHDNDLFVLKALLLIFLVVIFECLLVGCSSFDEDKKINCRVTCDECKNLQVDCDREKETENKELKPKG